MGGEDFDQRLMQHFIKVRSLNAHAHKERTARRLLALGAHFSRFSFPFLAVSFQQIVKKKSGVDLSDNQRAIAKLRREVEKAKRSLSTVHQVKVEIESLTDGEDFSETLTRAKFEELNNDLFRKTLTPLANVLKDSGLKVSTCRRRSPRPAHALAAIFSPCVRVFFFFPCICMCVCVL